MADHILEHLRAIDRSLADIYSALTCQAVDGWGRTRMVCGEQAVAVVSAGASFRKFAGEPFPVCANCRDQFARHGYQVGPLVQVGRR